MANILVPNSLAKHVRAGIRALHASGDSVDLAWKKRPLNFKSVYVRDHYSITPASHNDEKL